MRMRRRRGGSKYIVEVRHALKHHDVHAGPYGVEMPMDFTVFMRVVEVSVEVEIDGGGDGDSVVGDTTTEGNCESGVGTAK
jgi:hypothetical protein